MFIRWRDFDGKTDRRTYWSAWFVSLAVATLILILGASAHFSAFVLIYSIVVFEPMFSMTVRRLRDTGHKPTIAYVYSAIIVIGFILRIAGATAGVNLSFLIVNLSLVVALLIVDIIAFTVLVQPSVGQ
jgi:uncharacterized membrane protein YhaH (DUF805 family)